MAQGKTPFSCRCRRYGGHSGCRKINLSPFSTRVALEEEDVRGVEPLLARESLPEPERQIWGSIHPAMMGGEYLPDLTDGGVEIARISLKSTTSDQISVRASQEGNRIRYSVADEYDTEFDLTFETSDRPLFMGEMIEFLDNSLADADEFPGGW